MQAPFGLPTANPHVQITSTGTSDVKTATPPGGGHGFFCTVQTNNIYLTFDGTTPSSSNGLHILKDTAPIFFPVGKTLSVVSDAAGNAVVNILWLS